MALAMIEGAERAGRLRPGQPVVEYTGGSTGSSLAFVCAVTGHPLHIVTSDAFAEEKQPHHAGLRRRTSRSCPAPGHHPRPDPADAQPRRRAAPVAGRLPDRPVHQHRHGRWLPAAGRRGRSPRCPATDRCAVSATSAPPAACSGSASRCAGGTRRCSGSPWSPPSRPSCPAGPPVPTASRAAASASDPTCSSPDDVDEVVPVSTADAFAMARRAARVEGLLSGPSTGANLVAALHLAQRLGPGRRVHDRAGRLGAEVPDRTAVPERVTRRSTWRHRPTADRDAHRR